MKRLLIVIATAATMFAGLVLAPPAQATPPTNCLSGCLLSTTNGNVWQHTAANSYTSTEIQVIPSGASVKIGCYVYGESVNGDTVWYWLYYGGHWGYVSGWFLNTGHDPSSATHHC